MKFYSYQISCLLILASLSMPSVAVAATNSLEQEYKQHFSIEALQASFMRGRVNHEKVKFNRSSMSGGLTLNNLLPMESILEINFSAAKAWNQIIACEEGGLKTALQNYSQLKLSKCSKQLQSVREVKNNVRNLMKTFFFRSIYNFQEKSNFNFHPFFVQILLEIASEFVPENKLISYQHFVSPQIGKYELREFSDSVLRISVEVREVVRFEGIAEAISKNPAPHNVPNELETKSLGNLLSSEDFQKIGHIIGALNLLSYLPSSQVKSCLKWGLDPNATINFFNAFSFLTSIENISWGDGLMSMFRRSQFQAQILRDCRGKLLEARDDYTVGLRKLSKLNNVGQAPRRAYMRGFE